MVVSRTRKRRQRRRVRTARLPSKRQLMRNKTPKGKKSKSATELVSIIFERSKFSPREAEQWVKRHYPGAFYKVYKYDNTTHIKMVNLSKSEEERMFRSYRSKKVGDKGITLRFGIRKGAPRL